MRSTIEKADILVEALPYIQKFRNALMTVKFGGSSLADAKQFEKVAAIIKADPARRYVVPSAPGKRFSGDEKVIIQ